MDIKLIIVAILVGIIPITTFCISLYYMTKAIFSFYNMLQELKPEVTTRGYFLLGPLLLLFPKMFSEEGNLYKNNFVKYLIYFLLYLTPSILFLIFVHYLKK